jgi:hypothetical protein
MILDDLRAALPADQLIDQPDSMSGYLHDEAEWAASGSDWSPGNESSAALSARTH